MTSRDRNITVDTLDWRGVLIEIRYEAKWLGGDVTAHLQIETIEPARAPLPLTETGYRSHFIDADAVDEAGGSVAYILRWLDEAASRDRRWPDVEAAGRQLNLF